MPTTHTPVPIVSRVHRSRRVPVAGALSVMGLALAAVLLPGLVGSRTPRDADSDRLSIPSNAVARVGEGYVSEGELAAALERRPAAATDDAARARVLDELIRRELLFAEAERTGFTRRDDIRAAYKALVAARFEETRSTPSGDEADRSISEDEIQRRFDASPAVVEAPERRQAALVFLPVPPHATPDSRALAEAQIRDIRDRALSLPPQIRDLGSLAAQHSAHAATRHAGGDAGWMTRAQAFRAFPAEVANALFSLKVPGEIGPAVATREGWYLLRLVDVQPARTASLDALRERIRKDLARERASQWNDQYFANLRALHPVQILTQRHVPLAPGALVHSGQPPRLPAP